MAFRLPTFNITCDIYTGGTPLTTPRLTSICNLAAGPRSRWFLTPPLGTNESSPQAMTLLLPAGTDIRDVSCAGAGDMVECPSGSGRWYFVDGVDDYGKGFDNEHRFAILTKISHYGVWIALGVPNWPIPIP